MFNNIKKLETELVKYDQNNHDLLNNFSLYNQENIYNLKIKSCEESV